ncbi:hypothetical protein V1511DRAFT_487773 [Dipodascopsis uninucleata]
MSYSSHRGMNVPEYIANLNSIDPVDFPSVSSKQQQEDLSLFANTQFFDFDMGRSTDAGVSVEELQFDMKTDSRADRRKTKPAAVSAASSSPAVSPSSTTSSGVTGSSNAQQSSQSRNGAPAIASAGHVNYDFLDQEYIDYLTIVNQSSNGGVASSVPIHAHQGRPNGVYGAVVDPATVVPNMQHPGSSLPFTHDISSGPGMPVSTNGIKRASSITAIDMSHLSPDEVSRIAAEEDKRRRNTAASARFRIKKKQREQQMEKATKDLQEKVQQLEAKIIQLEMENKWLKNLVVEKNEAKAISSILNNRPTELSNKDSESLVKEEKEEKVE